VRSGLFLGGFLVLLSVSAAEPGDASVVSSNRFVYAGAPEARTWSLATFPAPDAGEFVAEGGYLAEAFEPGAVIALSAEVLDAQGKVLVQVDSSRQKVGAVGFSHRIRVPVSVPAGGVRVRLTMSAAANPVTFRPLPCRLERAPDGPLFRGKYDPEDPSPPDRVAALAELAKVPPATAVIERRPGRNVVVVDGRPMPFNQYKGFADYRLMGECGGHLVLTFGRGTRLFRSASFDAADRDEKTGAYDFLRIEDTLLRIHRADPEARVVLSVQLDPHRAFFDEHPEAIFVNEKGVRARCKFQSFGGFDSSPLDPKQVNLHWAHSYVSAAWRELVEDGLRRLCAYLKTTPASNIVIGFHLAGGMDDQYVQWQYGPENGHFDYSEAGRLALCDYLRDVYGTDAALQTAWGDGKVTLATARNPTVAEFRSRPSFDDRPGFGRRLADCRRFVAVGPARSLNGFARTLRREFGRPCLVDTWYTSSIWSQPGRLALDELVRDGGVDVILTVSNYGERRALDGAGCSANHAIAGLNLRGLVFVQEMDHRTWRTQHTAGWMSGEAVAFPRDADEFRNLVVRDAASVLAAGGAGYHLFDMFGSWYHDERLRPAIAEMFALNRFATDRAGRYPLPQAAIFLDEQARLLRENTYSCIDEVWRTSGVQPAIHYLSDLDNAALPDYDLLVVDQPVTLTAGQADVLKRRASVKGKVLVLVGEAGCGSRDFRDTAGVLAAFGVRARHESRPTADCVVPVDGLDDPSLFGVTGVLESCGASVRRGRLVRRTQDARTVVDDPEAKVLGRWQGDGRAAYVSKPFGGGLVLFMARDGGYTPRLLHNWARLAGIRPNAEPGNAVYVGNGIACVHRLTGPARVEFERPVRLTDFRRQTVSEPTCVWAPELAPGETAAVGYE